MLSNVAFRFDNWLYTAAVHRTVEAFCEVNDLGSEAALQLVRSALSRLNPGHGSQMCCPPRHRYVS